MVGLAPPPSPGCGVDGHFANASRNCVPAKISNTPRYKGGTVFHKEGELSGVSIDARADWDFSNGNRGMAKSVRGAKKYVNSRFRFHENAATRRLAEGAAAGKEE